MKAFFIIFLYFLFDRETYYILHSDTLSLIYVSLSKFFAVFVILMALIKQFNKNTLKVMGCICLVFFSMLISTVIKDGDVRRAIMIMYPVLAMGGLMLWQCSTFNRTKLFVRYIACFYFVLMAINFFFLLVSPSFFVNDSMSGESYFIGIENHVGYPMMKGLCFVLIDSYFRGEKRLLCVYIIMHVSTILIIFSGSNVVGLVCMLLFLIPNVIQRKIASLSLNTLLLVFVSLFVFVILFGNLMIILESPLVSYVIEDLLGKNLTLTNRTLIWGMVVDGFLNSPIIGNGVRETTSLFYISEQYTKGYMSAHNQILQSLYETGILFFVSLVPLFNELNKSLKSSVPFFSLIVKGSIFSFLVMYMAEAPGMDKILNLVVFGLLVSKMNNTVTCKGNMYVRCEK